MGVSAAETAKKHEEILDKSIRLFRQDGLNVSVGEVMKAAGLTHGPFYNHFSSKEALIVEALTRAMDRGSSELEEYPKTERGRRDYLDTYLSPAHASDLKGGCTIAALAVEVAREPGIAKVFTEKLKETIATFSEHFPWARGKRQARGLAIHAFSSMVGAVILARAVDDPVFAREILDETRKRIG